jgi:hypothetical protein
MRKLNLYLGEKTEAKSMDETLALLKRVLPSEMSEIYGQRPSQASSRIGYEFNETVDFSDKNTFQLYLVDYDSSSNYGGANSLQLLDRF